MNECQHKGCQNRAEKTIWPDEGPTVRLCEGHAQRDHVSLDDGRVLIWSDWDGTWLLMPEKWEPKNPPPTEQPMETTT